MNNNMSIYVKNSDLKDGEYVMDIDTITTNHAYVKDNLNINDTVITSETIHIEDEDDDIEEMTITNDITTFTNDVHIDNDLLIHGNLNVSDGTTTLQDVSTKDITTIGEVSITGNETISGNLTANNTITSPTYYGNVSNISTLNASTLNATNIYVDTVNPKTDNDITYTGEATFNNVRFKW